jgi:hypothetical protein
MTTENNIVPQILDVLKLLFPRTKPVKVIEKLEKAMEKELIETIFPQFSIHASKKSDRKSLPYQHEITVSLVRESYLNGMLEYHRCFRQIMKELLSKDVYKIRFYVHVTTDMTKAGPFNLGRINYHFRYYIHEIK